MKNHNVSPWLVVDDVKGANIGYRAIVTRDGDTVCDPSPMGEDRALLIAAAPVLLHLLELAYNDPDSEVLGEEWNELAGLVLKGLQL